MLILHLCTDPDDLLELKREVANLIENKIRAELEYRDSIFTTYAAVMARENLMLEDMPKIEFKCFLDRILDCKKEYHYVCLNPAIYTLIWLLMTYSKKDFKNLKIVLDGEEFTEIDASSISKLIKKLPPFPSN